MKEMTPKFTRAVVLQAFVKPFRLRGGDIEAVLDRNRIPNRALSDPNSFVEATSLYGAMEDMATSLGDQYFCANLARAAALSGVPTLRDSAAHAKNLADFLIGAVMETSRQFDNVVYSLNVTQEACVFGIRRTRPVRRPTTQVDATGVALYVSLLQTGLGKRFDADRILVSAPTIEGVPPDLLPAHALVRSTKTALSLTFPPEWLLAPFDLGWSSGIQRYAHPSLTGDDDLPFVFMREVIRNNIADKGFDLANLALACGTNRRRLQRIFAAHKTTFRAARDEVRRELAVDLVTRTNTPLKDVASQVGFSGESTFTRSYRRWTGQPPGTHRHRVKQSS